MRERYVYREGLGVVSVFDLDPVEESKRTALSAPYIISDTMDPIRSMADGRMYDSKSAYTRGVKALGCEIVGNDKLPERKPIERPKAGRDIKNAIDQLKAQPNR